MNKPEKLKQKHLEFLDNLRFSGIVNMFGARPYLQSRFPKLTDGEAKNILFYWMRTFSKRKKGEIL